MLFIPTFNILTLGLAAYFSVDVKKGLLLNDSCLDYRFRFMSRYVANLLK